MAIEGAPRTGPPVLFAEDDPVARVVLSQMLTACGRSFEVARDGEEAVELALRLKPAIVLLDVLMPRVGGIEAAKRIRARFEERPPFIAAITALTTNEVRSLAGSTTAFDDICVKPVQLATLRALLERAADGPQRGSPS